MLELELTYPLATGPVGVAYNSHGTSVTLELAPGETSADRALEAAYLLRQQILDSGGPELVLRDSYPPQQPDQAELDRLRFERRAIAHGILSAEFGAWNLGRVRRGEFTPLEIDAWLSSGPIRTILDKLRLYSFEVALALIAALPLGGPTTAEFKTVWTAKLEAAL